ncbi:Amicyanin-alpha [Zhongshania aliphaticivorans]|uniref:Amicyanin-alpha n=1 Tax=Zhongshania aliphaticivorans TaxID=1470434 RepID=A0A5S9NVL9_9GAMM|nr:cupredoxin domain-containing protein [Zhongshania aliphaticivorans]CAA0094706.1 Amicyanin-alpha [Zhongshania aliphaticivorans]CAA0112642.1 Amicyanin-alpha [Zhongshania aliphaticivorans]
MKKYYCMYTAAALTTMFLGAFISADVLAAGADAKVAIKSYKFGPQAITVQPGQSVVWENMDSSTHTVLIDGKESPRLRKGDDYSQMFSEPGVHKYQCGLHSSMKGVITVASAGMASSTSAHVAPSAVQVSSPSAVHVHSSSPSVPKQVTPSVPSRVSSSMAIKKVGSPSPSPVAPTPDAAHQKPNTVSIVDFMRFTPTVLKVKAGTTVTWDNLDGSNHIIQMGNVRSPRMRHHSSFTYTFDKPGEYPYICAIHGDKMSGTIIVM